MRSAMKAVAAAALMLACATALPAWAQAPAAPAGKCEFKKLGDVTVDMSFGQPRVSIIANGQQRWVWLGTSDTFSSLRKSEIAALGGAGGKDTKLALRKSNGDQELTHVRLTNVLVGNAVRLDAWDLIEADDSKWGNPAVSGVMGVDLLAGPDVELDLAHNRIAFFTATNCGDASLAYWDGAIDQADLYVPPHTALLQHFIRPKVVLDGHPVFAQLDTSAAISGVDSDFATLLNIRPGAPGVTSQGSYGSATMTAKFDTFAVGGETIGKPTLTLWKFPNLVVGQTGSNIRLSDPNRPSIILGRDFLKAHRVLIANSQHKMYFSYNGGPVFRTPAATQ